MGRTGFCSELAPWLLAALLAGCARKVADVGSSHGVAAEAGVHAGVEPGVQVSDSGHIDASNSDAYYAASPLLPPGMDGGLAPGIPMRLVGHDGRISGFSEANGRLVWITQRTVPPQDFFIRTCAVQGCAGTLRSFRLAWASRGNLLSWFWTNTTHAFWPSLEQGYAVSFCPQEDCSAPGTLPFPAEATTFVADERRAFFGAADACELDDCEHTHAPLATQIRSTPRSGSQVVRGGTHVVLDGDFIYALSANSSIVRIPKDASGDVLVIAADQLQIGDLAVRDGFVYWSEKAPLGRIFRCPVTGCAGVPETLASGQSSPHFLAVDEREVYFTSTVVPASLPPGAVFLGERLAKCPVDGCTSPTNVLEREGVADHVIVDGDFVYFIGVECPGGPCTAYIGAVTK